MSLMNKDDLECFRDYRCKADNAGEILTTITLFADGGHLIESVNPLVQELAAIMSERLSLYIDVQVRDEIKELNDV